MSVGAGADPGL